MKILLDYAFPIIANSPIPAASTAMLKQVCLVCKPKSGQEGNVGEIYECANSAAVAARTDNENADQFFSAGMSKVYILLSDDLDLEDALDGANQFYTVVVSDDFDDEDIESAQADGEIQITSYANLVSGTDDSITVAGVVFTAQTGAAVLGETTFQAATSDEATATSLAAQINAHTTTKALVEATVDGDTVTITAKRAGADGNDIAVAYTDHDTNVGAVLSGLSGGKLSGGSGLIVTGFKGVVGLSSDDRDLLRDQSAIEKRCAFYDEEGAENLCFAFGSLLANLADWKNQQYTQMPEDGVADLGTANSLFDDRVSFVLKDDEFGNRLGLFVAGGQAIAAPYILKNLMIDLQSAAVSWINTNQPDYTKAEASLLEDRLQIDIINARYIARKWIPAGTISIELLEDNFVATGDIQVTNPRALWRIFGELTAQ